MQNRLDNRGSETVMKTQGPGNVYENGNVCVLNDLVIGGSVFSSQGHPQGDLNSTKGKEPRPDRSYQHRHNVQEKHAECASNEMDRRLIRPPRCLRKRQGKAESFRRYMRQTSLQGQHAVSKVERKTLDYGVSLQNRFHVQKDLAEDEIIDKHGNLLRNT